MGWTLPSDQSWNFPMYQYFLALGKWVLRNMEGSLPGRFGFRKDGGKMINRRPLTGGAQVASEEGLTSSLVIPE